MVVDPARLQHKQTPRLLGCVVTIIMTGLEISLFPHDMQLKLQSIIPIHNKFGYRTVPSLRMNGDIDNGQRCLRRDKNSRWWQVFALSGTLNGCFVVGPWKGGEMIMKIMDKGHI